MGDNLVPRSARAIQHRCQNLLEPFRLEQTVGEVLRTRLSSFSIGIERPLQPVSSCRDDAIAERRRGPFQKPCRAFSFNARRTCLAFSFDWYSSNSAMICRIITCIGSSPISWVIETSLTPFFASLRT